MKNAGMTHQKLYAEFRRYLAACKQWGYKPVDYRTWLDIRADGTVVL